MMKTDSGFIVAGGEKKRFVRKGDPCKKKWGETRDVTENEQNKQQSRAETGQTNDQNQQ